MKIRKTIAMSMFLAIVATLATAGMVTAYTSTQNIEAQTVVPAVCTVGLNDSYIVFGSVSPGTDTGAANQAVLVTNNGNAAAINTTVNGTQWSDGGVNNFVVGSTEWATAGFAYGAGTDMTGTPVAVPGGNLAASATLNLVFGVGVPGGQTAATYNQTIAVTMNC